MRLHEELQRITESLAEMERRRDCLLNDEGLQQELEFVDKFNALMDEFNCPVSLLLEVLTDRPDVPSKMRARLAEAGGLAPVAAAVKSRKPTRQAAVKSDENDAFESSAIDLWDGSASANVAEWKEKFGHRSLASWFNQ